MIERVTIIGAGRVGGALATRLHDVGIAVRVVKHAEFEKWCSSDEAVGDIVVIAVRDSDVQLVADSLARGASTSSSVAPNARFSNTLVIHVNGSMRLDVLRACAVAGGRVGAAHPFQTFADADAKVLDGIGWGIECADDVWPLLVEFVELTDGVPFRLDLVDDHHKRIYHTAAIAASNYTYAAYELARRLAQKAGIPPKIFLQPIIKQTHLNAAHALLTNTAFPLTGPIQRGDVAAVSRQLDSMPAEERTVYVHLSLALLHLNKDSIPHETFAKMSALLSNALLRL